MPVKKSFETWVSDLREQGIQVESHLRLFTYEAVQHMTAEEFETLRLKYIAQEPYAQLALWNWGIRPGTEIKSVADHLLTKWRNGDQYGESWRRSAKADLYELILAVCRDHPDAIADAMRIVKRCKKVDPQAYKELSLHDLTTFDYYRRMFDPMNMVDKMDRISGVLEPQVIYPELRQRNAHEYENLLKRVENAWKRSMNHGHSKTELVQKGYELQNELDFDWSACLLLRGLPLCTDTGEKGSAREPGDWYYHFLEACDTSPMTRMLPRFIDLNAEEDLARWHAHKKVENRSQSQSWASNIVDFVNQGEAPQEPRDPRAYVNYQTRTAGLDFEPYDYTLRPYQNELVGHAHNGKNTIICAPTGSGKTLVATDVIRAHLDRARMEDRVARCVMLVPTVPLVDQQCVAFVEHLGGTYWIDGFSGCENYYEDRAQRLLACDLCVMTPQILINMLNTVLRSERVYFADFTLMIFDECHHCDKSHPYKILMDQLAESNLVNKPQIVGLTASMGVGDTSWDMHACREHMLALCSNLMAETISTVRHQLENLKDYVKPPVDIVRKVFRPAENEFLEAIKSCMLSIQRAMQPDLERILREKLLGSIGKEEIAFPNIDDQAQYQTRVGLLKKNLHQLKEDTTRLFLIRSIENLSCYFHAIAISDLLPDSFALEYLNTKMAAYKGPMERPEFQQINRQLMDRYETLKTHLEGLVQAEQAEKQRRRQQAVATGRKYGFERKQILNALYEILRDQFTKDPNSRAMIFVATRACAQRLAAHLMQIEEELPMFYKKKCVAPMVSSNQSSAMSGQSSEEQRQVRENFEKGIIKVLVVTSVAEEGMNIVACNLIVKYNNVGSERQMIQRRGRARQMNSKSILLALDTGVEQQEFNNMQKEAMMLRCMEDLQEQDEMSLRKKIEKKSAEMAQLRKDAQMQLEYKRAELKDKRYKLNCVCGTLICHSDMVRSIMGTLYVCCDPTVWSRSKHTLTRTPTKEKFYTLCARWECANCNEHWGQIVKYSNVFLPELRVKAFVMERVDQQRGEFDRVEQVGKKWKSIEESNFNVDAISMADIRKMYEKLLEHNHEWHKEYEKQSVQADEQVRRKLQDWKTKERKERVLLEE